MNANKQELPNPKPAHDGIGALPYGKDVWLLERDDGVLIGYWKTRHAAIGAAALLQNEDWYNPICVKAGQIPLRDVRSYE